MARVVKKREQILRYGFAAVAGAVYYIAHGPLAEYQKNLKTNGGYYNYHFGGSKRKGILNESLEITPQTCKLIDQVKAEIPKINEVSSNLHFEHTPSALPRIFGSPYCGNAFILLPEWINVTNISDLNSEKLNSILEKTYGWKVPKPNMWFTGAGKLLVDSFVMSDDAKKFLIAREIGSSMNTDLYKLTGLVTACFLCFNYMISLFEKKYRTPVSHFPRKHQIAVISISGISVSSAYYLFQLSLDLTKSLLGDAMAVTKGESCLKDLNDTYKEFKSSEKIDIQYYHGGIEYYNKEIQRHQALRQLISQNRYKFTNPVFTPEGDWNQGVFKVEMTTSDRLDKIRKWKEGRELVLRDIRYIGVEPRKKLKTRAEVQEEQERWYREEKERKQKEHQELSDGRKE